MGSIGLDQSPFKRVQPKPPVKGVRLSNFNDPRHSFINALLENQRKKEALESKLSRWAQSPSQSEIERCERAVRMVKAAIDADPKLATMDISVFGKGSFYNRTNIPADSDVDVGVRLNTIFNNEYPAGKVNADFDFETASYGLVQFRQDLAAAMVNYFGVAGVTVGSKAIKVHSTTARVDADVVPHAVHRRYHADGSHLEGVAMRSNGKVIYNWPDQDYANGVEKNSSTSRNYKAMVRILKNLRGEMEENGIFAAKRFSLT